jgi:hypothetical protein
MVAVSTLLPVELLSQIWEDLETADLLSLMRCGILGRELGDIELWRRLVQVVRPFLQLFDTLLLGFLHLLQETGLAIVGDTVLDLLLFANRPIPAQSTSVQELHVAVNVSFFSQTIDFFKSAGYQFYDISSRDGLKDPGPENVVGTASGIMTSTKVRYLCELF